MKTIGMYAVAVTTIGLAVDYTAVQYVGFRKKVPVYASSAWQDFQDGLAESHGYEPKDDGPVTEAILAQISMEAADQGVEPALARAVARRESSLNEDAESSAMAMGVMQVTKAAAKEMGIKPSKLYHRKTNIKAGVGYLRFCLNKTGGNEEAALVCYNAGPGNLDKAFKKVKSYVWNKLRQHVPKETQEYVPAVLALKKEEMNNG